MTPADDRSSDIVNEVCQFIQVTGRPIDGEAIQLASKMTTTQLAKIGIQALIDEATGFQPKRDPDALNEAPE